MANKKVAYLQHCLSRAVGEGGLLNRTRTSTAFSTLLPMEGENGRAVCVFCFFSPIWLEGRKRRRRNETSSTHRCPASAMPQAAGRTTARGFLVPWSKVGQAPQAAHDGDDFFFGKLGVQQFSFSSCFVVIIPCPSHRPPRMKSASAS